MEPIHDHQQPSAAGLDDPYPGKLETMVTPEETVNRDVTRRPMRVKASVRGRGPWASSAS